MGRNAQRVRSGPDLLHVPAANDQQPVRVMRTGCWRIGLDFTDTNHFTGVASAIRTPRVNLWHSTQLIVSWT